MTPLRVLALLCVCACAMQAGNCDLPVGTILRVTLKPGSPRSLKAKAPVEGSIEAPVFRGACKALPAGVPAKVSNGGGRVALELRPAGQSPLALRVSALRFSKERRATAGGKPGPVSRKLLVKLEESAAIPGAVELPALDRGAVAAGAQLRVAVESKLSSKDSRGGEVVTGRLLEPLFVGDKVLLPEGALVNGTVSRAKRAGRPYRAGALSFGFHSLQFAANQKIEAPLTISGGELSGGSRIDKEGAITGSALTKTRALINLGVAYAVGKVLDDVVEESAKGIWSAAASGSARTAARYISLGTGLAIFLLHRGREVKIDPETEFTVSFSRPVEIAK